MELAVVSDDLKFDIYLIIKDSTCGDVTFNRTEAEEIVRRSGQLIKITTDLKEVLEGNSQPP